MKNNKTYIEWLDAAYNEFAANGPNFSLKALSTRAKLPRATLYYHFDNKDHIISELLKNHLNLVDNFNTELLQIQVLIPDLYTLLYKYKMGVKFHQQLQRNFHIQEYRELYYKCNSDSIKILLPYIRTYYNLNHSDEEVFKFYSTLTDTWYSRLDFSNLTVENMISLAEEIMENILKLTLKVNP